MFTNGAAPGLGSVTPTSGSTNLTTAGIDLHSQHAFRTNISYDGVQLTVAIKDLLYTVQLIYAANYQEIPLLVVAAIWYIGFTSVLYVGQYYLERYYGRGVAAYLEQPNRRRLPRRAMNEPLRVARRPDLAAGLAVLKFVELSGIATGVVDTRMRRTAS